MKRKGKPRHTAAEDAHLNEVAELGCIACEMDGHPGTPAAIHHPRRDENGNGIGASVRAPHEEGIPLCEGHHQGEVDTTKIAIHKEPTRFIARYGTEKDLVAKVRERLRRKREQESIFVLPLNKAV
jgi:hypothetical protein